MNSTSSVCTEPEHKSTGSLNALLEVRTFSSHNIVTFFSMEKRAANLCGCGRT
jgi:hypothetical protein